MDVLPNAKHSDSLRLLKNLKTLIRLLLAQPTEREPLVAAFDVVDMT